MSGINPVFTTEVYELTLDQSYKDELMHFISNTDRNIQPIDYTAPDAVLRAFETIPYPSQPIIDSLISQLQVPISHLRNHQVIAFPTETVYGLAGDASDDQAIARIFQAKGRPSDNPLIVHISNSKQLEQYTQQPWSPLLPMMIQHFWPGPLSIILKHNNYASSSVTAGLDTVALRMPAHPVALALIQGSSLGLAAPSSNSSGKPSPTASKHVLHDLLNIIPGVINGKITLLDHNTHLPTSDILDLDCYFGVESTVIDFSHVPPNLDIGQLLNPASSSVLDERPLIYILRPGAITKSMLESVVGVGRVEYDPALLLTIPDDDDDNNNDTDNNDNIANTTTLEQTAHQLAVGQYKPRAPGMKYTHYAPNAPVYIVTSEDVLLKQLLQRLSPHIDHRQQHEIYQQTINDKTTAIDEKQQRIGLLCTEETRIHILSSLEQYNIIYNPDILSIKVCGSRTNMRSIAAALYGALRDFDLDDKVDIILAEIMSHDDLGAAVVNRLLKAAGGKVIRQ